MPTTVTVQTQPVYGLPRPSGVVIFRRVVQSLPGLVAYWRCNEASGTTLTDTMQGDVLTLAGSGTSLGAAGATPDGGPPLAAAFNGSGWATTAGMGNLPSGSAARTFALFFKSSSGALNTMFSYGAGNECSLIVNYPATGNACLYNGTAYGVGSGLNDGLWHLFIITYDGAILTRYIDTLTNSSSTGGVSLATSAGNRGIGRDIAQSGYPMVGSVDEVCVWNRALSQADVLRLMTAGAVRN